MNQNVKDYYVNLEVPKKTGSNIKIKKGKTICPSGSVSGYGCLDVKLNDEAIVKFRLSSKVASTPYHVTKMIICKVDVDGDKDSQDCNLNTVEERDQFAIMEMGGLTRYHPKANGVIKFDQIPRRLSEFKFINLNKIKQDYFYTIEACDSANTDCRETDPMIRNGGKQ